MTDKDNNWSGALWNETESVIHKKGSITHKTTGEKDILLFVKARTMKANLSMNCLCHWVWYL